MEEFMKRKLLSVLFAVIFACAAFAGCFGNVGCFESCFGGNKEQTDDTPKEYTVKYTLDGETVQLKVTQGKLYELEAIPEMTGYNFIGLFDAQTDGNKIVDENGSSLAPFNGNSDIVLFPRFEPKEYTIILDYQGAEVSGARQVKAVYDQSLPELPTEVVYEHKEFTGWYKGKKVTVTLIQNNTSKRISVNGSTQLTAKQRLKLDLSDILPAIGGNGLNIAYKLNFKWGNNNTYYSASGRIALYEGSDFSSANEIKTKDLSHGDDYDAYIADSISGSANIKNKVLYVYYAGKGNGRIYLNGGKGFDVGFFDIYAEIFYPITTNLFV